MQSPEFFQQMSTLMSNPAILDQIMALNPQLATMAPQIREVFQSEQFRQMVSVTFLFRRAPYVSIDTFLDDNLFANRSNPDTLRTMMQMSSAMRGAQGGFGGGPLGAAPGAFPAPGVPSAAAGTGTTSPTAPSTTTPPGATGTGPNAGPGAGLPNPALLQALLGAGAFGGGLGGGLGGGPGGGFSGLGGGLSPFGAPAVPADTRPPEERFQVQLQVRPTDRVS